jgi:hypothetical protein
MAKSLRIVHLVGKFRLGLFVLFLLAAPAAQGGELMKVTLINGDTFVAQKDERSDERRLWLRFVGESDSLRFVFWGDVSAIEKVDSKPAVAKPSTAPGQSKSKSSYNVQAVASKPGRNN